MTKSKKNRVFFFMSIALVMDTAVAAEQLTLEQVLQRVVDNALNLKVADLQYAKSQLEKDKLDSMFGWQVGNQVTASHDVGFGSIPTDRLNVGANAGRMMPNGDKVSVTASYTFENADAAIIPSLPNPSNDAKVDISYRRPFWQGAGNPVYDTSKRSAEAGEAIAKENLQVVRDQLSAQAVDIYYGIIATLARIKNVDDAVLRTQRMMEYVKRKENLGLSEQKDLLGIEAQQKAQAAELKLLRVTLEQQRTALNRLMYQSADSSFTPVLPSKESRTNLTAQVLIDQSIAYHPGIRVQEARIKIAESNIERARDNRKSKLDGFIGGGLRAKYGDAKSVSGAEVTINEQDYAILVGIDYQRALDKRNIDTEIAQAELDKTIAMQEIDSVRRDVNYNVVALLNEIETIQAAISAYEVRVEKEKQKLDEGVERYKRGRADTQQLILFENDLSTAEFLVEQQRIELAKRYSKLDLLRGAVWQRVVPAVRAEGN